MSKDLIKWSELSCKLSGSENPTENEMNDNVKELIELYEAILHGTDTNYGLFDCYDTYYKGCWDEQLKKVETLKKELRKENKV